MSVRDDIVAPFSLDGAPVRGRIVRLGAGSIDPILARHAYPRPVALLLGEAVALAALVGSLLKAQGRLVVQAQGEGDVPLLMAEHRADGALRGYARLAEGAANRLAGAGRMAPGELLGAGALVMTLDQGSARAPHQGVVPLEGDTLAACAETYFRDSEQTDTRIRLAVGELVGEARVWRAGGILVQRVAGDSVRGDTAEDWTRAGYLFETLGDDELVDPALGSDRVLYRLFHEEGARMAEPAALRDECGCDRGRLAAVLSRFTAEEIADLAEADGAIHARCQFCARVHRIEAGEVACA